MPLLLQLLRGPGPAVAAVAPAAAAAAGPRFLTPEQLAAVDAAFAVTLPKAKVRWIPCLTGRHVSTGRLAGCAAPDTWQACCPAACGVALGQGPSFTLTWPCFLAPPLHPRRPLSWCGSRSTTPAPLMQLRGMAV